jgi:hypothetical protein
MEIFKQLKKLGYKHYVDLTIEELDKLPNDNIEKRIEYSLVIDWFREKHDIIIDIGKIYNGTDNWHFALNYEWEYFEGTYYEAREAAILKAIEVCQKK